MLGEEEKIADVRSFSSKSPVQRLSIIAAGPIMNFILAIVLFSVIGSIRGFQIPVVERVEKDKPAYTSGIEKGDKIIAVNNNKIKTWDDFFTQVYMANGNSLNIKLLIFPLLTFFNQRV
jgi:regulator of sigma E protease